jgi:hypothetical protein
VSFVKIVSVTDCNLLRGLNVFLHIFPIFLDRSGKNSVQKSHNASSKCKFREYLCSGIHALIMGVDELMVIFATLLFRFV